MKSIHSEDELIKFIEAVLGRPMNTDESARYSDRLSAYNDPRYGYDIIETRDRLAFWLVECGGYSLTMFVGGIGIYDNTAGGCRGYLSDKLVADMVECNEMSSDGGSVRLTYDGLNVLKKITAKRWLDA